MNYNKFINNHPHSRFMNHKITTIVFSIFLLTGMVGIAQAVSIGPAGQYNPQINPADFTMNITNPYFSLPIGKKTVYQSKSNEGTERIEILIPGWTKTVMGVETIVLWDRVYLNGTLIEDTRDYLAQNKNGDVWYFGEHVDSYEKGTIKDHDGTWIAGVDGAKPGIWALAKPQVGDEFRNEYYAKHAEDITKILALNETVTVPQGTFTGCIKTLEWTPLNPNTENKYYCKQIADTALEVDLPGPKHKVEVRGELLQMDLRGALGIVLPVVYAKDGIVDSSLKTNSGAGVSGKDQVGKRYGKETDGNEQGEGADWPGIIVSGLIGLILGVVLQKFLLGKHISK